jgi:hypothetical protein
LPCVGSLREGEAPRSSADRGNASTAPCWAKIPGDERPGRAPQA